ncbi:MAG: hypothetical protein LBI68_00290 [Azoarcus sp.]|jgi:hypothetical protein|nr:hypothetical protein [Azoarcus sp.]
MRIKALFHILALLSLAVCINAAHAQASYDRAESVKVNGVELSGAVSTEVLPANFWEGKLESINFYGCTANYNIRLDYKDKKATLEIFSEDNPKIDLEKIFSQQEYDHKKHPVKARIWLDWFDMKEFSDLLEIDGRIIKPDITFKQFKQMFPASAKSGEDYSDAERAVEGGKIYFVMLGEDTESQDAESRWYDQSVAFVFKNEILIGIALRQGIAC